jgi:hypothetical protein
MNRFKRGSAILAALLFLSEAKAVFASTINYLDLSAESYNGGDSVGQVSGLVTYNSTTGATASIGSGGGTTYSEPTALGLTSATIQTSSSDYIDSCIPGGCSIGTVTSSALATGDLATGSVGVYSFPSQVGAVVSEGTASAILKDTLTFNVAGASPSTTTDIGVTFTVDGNVSYAQNASAQLIEAMTFGCGTNTCGDISYGFNGGSNQIIEDGGWVSQNLISESADSFIFSGVYALSGASDILPIEVELKAECQGAASCDISHTGAVSFTLPSNVTFTSQSGVFLTQPLTTATPEPSYAVLLGLGLAGTMFLARRVRRPAARQS